jgi:AhpC/TSA family
LICAPFIVTHSTTSLSIMKGKNTYTGGERIFEGIGDMRASLPQIGYKAPQFTAVTTFGEMTLADFEGKWVVMFSHIGDLSPVTKMLNAERGLCVEER